jgi:polysaccharide chain length determinant protein (PEP-CTERM system associated)
VDEEEVSIGEQIGKVGEFLRRRRWWIASTTVLIALGAAAVAFILPNQYESEATLEVVQQEVSRRFVEPSSVATAADSFKNMSKEILSRTRLAELIDAFPLYPKEKDAKVPAVQLVGKIRKDIDFEVLDLTTSRDINSFKITFRASTPALARDVTGRLTQLFIDENLKKQSNQSAATTNFLADRLETAKQRLAQQEEKLRSFKTSNLNELPQQEQANLSALTEARIQVQGVSSNLMRVRQHRTALQTDLTGYMARLQSEKDALLKKFTPKHQEVAKKDEELRKTEELLNLLKSGVPGGGSERLSGTESPLLVQLRGQIETNLSEGAELAREEERLKAEVGHYQARLSLTPLREQQLGEVLRDYETYKQDYNNLLSKQLSAQLTATAEARQEGQHFRLIDPPTLPTAPSGPKRLIISLSGIGAGLFIGLLLAGIAEMRDHSFHNDGEIAKKFGVPMVVGIPTLLTPDEARSRKRRRALEGVAAAVMLLVVSAAELYVYRLG